MDQIVIRGGQRLKGRIPISGAKNAALTLLPCALLTDEPLTLRNLPRLADVDGFGHLLNQLGCSTTIEGSRPEDFGRVMTARATTLTHLKALEAFGAEIELASGYVKAVAPGGRLAGGKFTFPVVSVGATENAVMAAVLAKGTCVLENAAREPEIVDLCNCLVAMGAHIDGIGTETLTIEGVDRLHGATYRVMADRIEAGSYACAAVITQGDVELVGAKADEMEATLAALREAGATVETTKAGIRVAMDGRAEPVTLSTAPYPGFATDMQAQFMAMATLGTGASLFTETIFENRYMHVPELARMGCDIQVKGRTAIVRGVDHLVGAPVMATDLRASMSLIIAGLAAQGQTEVNRVYHLDRGYERLEEKLQAVGADIERISAG